MRHTDARMISDAYVPVAVADRSGRDESVHFGAAVAIDAAGAVVAAHGDESVEIYPRSALKPLQADAMLQLGWHATDRQVALACASHDGSPEHLDVVRSTLADAGLDEAVLRNTAAWPRDTDEAEAVIAAGAERRPLLMNCSGKHAAMVATCVANGWPIESYLDADHPLQRAITEHVGVLGARVSYVGVDGCGAPTHIIPLVGLAEAYRRLADGRSRCWTEMRSFPHLVAGDRFPSTQLMRAVPGLMAKGGAEGVFAAALPDGGAIALKIADGADRATGPVAAAMLRSLGVELDVDAFMPPMLGHDEQVGRVRPVVGAVGGR